MVIYYTTYKNGDDWGMVQMALFYSHYCHPWAGKPSQPVEHVVTGSPKGVCQEFGGWCPSNSTEISSPYILIQRKYGVNLYQLCYKSTINLHVVSTPIFIKSTFMGHNKKWVHAWPIPTCRMAHILVPAFHGGHRDGAAWGWLEVPRGFSGISCDASYPGALTVIYHITLICLGMLVVLSFLKN